jgi:anti-sigma factor RsiW
MSEMNENDCEMLEAFLDQELSEEQQSGLRARLSSDEALASQLEQLRAERKTREELFTSFEGGEAAVVDRILGSLNAKNSPRNNLRRIFFAAAAAACIVLGFLIGWMGHTNGQSNAVAGEPPYRVEIRR